MQTKIDELITKVTSKLNGNILTELNEYFYMRSYLVGYNITTPDLLFYNNIKVNKILGKSGNKYPNLMRYYNTLDNCSYIKSISENGGNNSEQKTDKSSSKVNQNLAFKDEGSWDIGISRKDWMGKVVTRFPPEPSGYLHIGHAKAVCIGSKIASEYNGKFIVRMDDTNPVKEKAEFEENIIRDLRTLGVNEDMFSHTSDYFDYYIECCTRIIKSGHAYADKTDRKTMKQEREERIENAYRKQDINENLRLWNEMLKGSTEGITCCIRIKLDMKSNKGTLRDPVIYRCNIKDSHHQTGKKYKVYPTYDFACPIVDSIEGVTHVFRSKEYNERDVQYRDIWNIVCKGQKYKGKELKLGNIYQFSRQEFVRTVLSKRKLSDLIARGVVSGWDDPRLPTVQGIFRRGLQIEALINFVKAQAMTKKNNKQEWDKLWTFNKKILDPKVGRYFCVSNDKVLLTLTNVSNNNSCKSVPVHPKHKNGAKKLLTLSNEIYIERFDAEAIKQKSCNKIILMNWGIINITKINTDNSGNIVNIVGNYDENDKKFKGLYGCTWVNKNDDLIPVTLVELDYLFNDDGTESNNESWKETSGLSESSLRLLSKGDIIQYIKRGFYIIDKPYIGRNEPAVLIFIPDGKETAMSKLGTATNKIKYSNK